MNTLWRLSIVASFFALSCLRAEQISPDDSREADAQLKGAIGRVLDYISSADLKNDFLKSQNAWATFRELEARFLANFTKLPDSEKLPKDILETSYRKFYVEITKQRIKYLDETFRPLP